MSNHASRTESGGEDEPPDDLATFQSILRKFKRDGCNLLVVGDAPREVFTRTSESMLGDPDARRWRVFGLTDATTESVRARLPAASTAARPPEETVRIVNYPLPPRQVTDCTRTADLAVPEVTVDDEDLHGLRTELVDAIEEFGERRYRPAELRLAVDSLAPLLDHYDLADVRQWVETIGHHVREHDGMAHYVFPEPYDSDRCRRLRSAFDAVVELRTTAEDVDHDAEERWHVSETGKTMPWVPTH